jgi:hypothetical protein
MLKPKLWHYRTDIDGRVQDEEPENPWLRRPEGIGEQLLHAAAMSQLEAQWTAELLASRRYIDLKPSPAEEQRLKRLYAADATAPSSEVLLREVAEGCERMRDHKWSAILDRLEAEYRARSRAALDEIDSQRDPGRGR